MKRSSLGIDFYLWLTYRTFTLRRPLRLSWPRLYRQFGVDPVKAGDNRTVDNFRTDCLRELKKIKVAWPVLNYAAVQGRTGPFALETRCASPCGSFSSWNSPQVSFAGPESFPVGSRRPRRDLFSWVSKTDRF